MFFIKDSGRSVTSGYYFTRFAAQSLEGVEAAFSKSIKMLLTR